MRLIAFCGFWVIILSLTSPAAAAETVRKTFVVRGRDYTVDIFYVDGKEVARQKQSSQKTFDREGALPQGKVTFRDDYQRTTGEEYYSNGKRHGMAKTYFPDGRVMKEEYYVQGELLLAKEYYPNGNLRMEVDYTRVPEPQPGQETGWGKLYYQDGKVKYEWNFIRPNADGYRKAYDPDGALRLGEHYDAEGRLTERKTGEE